MYQKESHTRTLLKAISWRIITSLTTTILVYLFFGKLDSAAIVGILKTFLKIFSYYIHNNVESFLSLEVSKRKVCDIELICNGAFLPLDHFMNKDKVMNVAFKLNLNGTLWSIPIMLPISKDILKKHKIKTK